jgi:hypothetical protein
MQTQFFADCLLFPRSLSKGARVKFFTRQTVVLYSIGLLPREEFSTPVGGFPTFDANATGDADRLWMSAVARICGVFGATATNVRGTLRLFALGLLAKSAAAERLHESERRCQPRAKASVCLRKSSPCHSASEPTTFLRSYAAFCAARASAWRFTKSACVVMNCTL